MGPEIVEERIRKGWKNYPPRPYLSTKKKATFVDEVQTKMSSQHG